ncbi:hypothetical protein AN958_03152 [Leucoagaricus sp. SymC.cos]|nr:hypothetical protein AN958_03152 [Leucoagaricus sp. SymC.cos]
MKKFKKPDTKFLDSIKDKRYIDTKEVEDTRRVSYLTHQPPSQRKTLKPL